MTGGTWQIVALAFLPLLVRLLLYLFAFKIRSIHCTFLNTAVIAGSPYLVVFIPLHLPALLGVGLSIGLAMVLMTRYTEAEIYPDIILIAAIVELGTRLVAIPLLTSLIR